MKSSNDLKHEIIASIDVIHFYQKYIDDTISAAQSDGWTKRMLCPIHKDNRTPNFAINVKTGGFNCFACRDRGGSIFDFWLIMNGLSAEDGTNFKKALAALATEANIDISKWKDQPRKQQNFSVPDKKDDDSQQQKTFIPRLNKADSHDAANEPIHRKVCKKFSDAINANHVKFLLKKRGLKKTSIDKFQIGFDETWMAIDEVSGSKFYGRITIPVLNAKGECRNIRGYSSRVTPAFKMVNYISDRETPDERKHGSPPRLFGLNFLVKEKWDHVVICEGEFDCILLNQFFVEAGLKTWGAVTGTHGVKKFESEWLQYFFGKYVYICFDCDSEGKLSASSVANKHFLEAIKVGKFNGVRIVTLPLEGSKVDNDITDYFLKNDYTVNDFITLCNESDDLISGGMSSDEATVEAIEVDDFVTAIKDRRYIDKRVRVPITISGATSKTYHAIRSYEVSSCPLAKSTEGECCNDGVGVQYIPYGHPLFIEACMNNMAANLRSIASIACHKQQKCKVKPVSKVVMEEYFAHQVVERWKSEEMHGKLQNAQELIQVPIYILQPEDNKTIEPQNYRATGFVRTHPKTSVATFFVEEMEAMEEDWKKFSIQDPESNRMIREIGKFSVNEIIKEITSHVTKIYESDEILYTVLLTYLSPLCFYFNNTVLRGWLNTAIIGDSGTGKSKTYERFSDWIELGDLFSALSGTRTGLLYAIKQRMGEWHVSIGRYVQASGKIIAVDETQETPAEEIKRMAVAMDTGFLSIEQVASGGYHTRTRTIFILNPKDARGKASTISDFTCGCESLRQCFDPMFIRRLDLVVFTNVGKSNDWYNKKTEDVSEMTLSSRMMKSLVYWAWTRKPDQIVWDDTATSECLSLSTKLSDIYGFADDIPLVNPQDFRENLARLSVSYAILDRSFDETLEKVKILPKHVNAMANFVDTVYSSEACDLRQKSTQAKSRNTLDDFGKISKVLERLIKDEQEALNEQYRKSQPFCQLLLLLEQLDAIRKRDLSEQIGVRVRWIQSRMAVLQGFNLITLGRWGYKKTRKFNLFMKKWRGTEKINDMLDNVYEKVGSEALREDPTNDWFDEDSFPGESEVEETKYEQELDPF